MLSDSKPESDNPNPKRKKLGLGFAEPHRKRRRWSASPPEAEFFEGLPDDLVLLILSKLSCSASSPSDIVAVLLTCKRFKELGMNPMVLGVASAKSLAIRAEKWSDSAHRFLKLCVDCGNLEACYILGMIRFYCLGNTSSGAALMARAAMGSHAAALYSLAVIQFNGSGRSKSDKDLPAGAALCSRAAFLGHIDALRELGHCLQDGYGLRRNIADGRRLLVQANLLELASSPPPPPLASAAAALLSDFGWAVAEREAHAANRFLADWFTARGGELGDGRRMCSHDGCGRPETRRHEFRRCSVCGVVNYCSRACQAMHWKLKHKAECAPAERWGLVAGGDAAAEQEEEGGGAAVG